MLEHSVERKVLKRQLRASLAHSLNAEALLVSEELLLHGPRKKLSGGEFQARALALLRRKPTVSEGEQEALKALSLDEQTKITHLLEAHLDSSPSLPDRDLAVFQEETRADEELASTAGFDPIDQIARLANAANTGEIETSSTESPSLPQEPVQPEPTQPLGEQALPDGTGADEARGDHLDELRALEAGVEAVQWDLAAALDPSRLTPLPLAIAALEAVGFDKEQFGFLLRYGALAPEGRASEFKIAGMGMAEFSRRAADWFEAMGAAKFPVQVVDDGSGNLTVYLLETMNT